MTTSQDVKGTAFQRDTPHSNEHSNPSARISTAKTAEAAGGADREAWIQAYRQVVDLQEQTLNMRGLVRALEALLSAMAENTRAPSDPNLEPSIALSRVLDRLWEPFAATLDDLELRCYRTGSKENQAG